MNKYPLIRLLQYAQKQRRQIVLASIFSILKKLFDIAPPLLIGMAVDLVVKKQDSFIATLGFSSLHSQLWFLSIVTVLIWGLESLFQFLHTIYWRNIAQELQHNLRVDTWQHLQNLEMEFFEKGSSGTVMAILNDDVNQLERFLDVGANSILQLLTTIIVIGGIFFYFSPLVASFAIIPMPFIVIGAFFFHKKIETRYTQVREQVAILNSRLVNSLGGIATIKSFTSEDWETQKLREDSLAYREANRKAIKLSSAFIPLIRIVIMCGFISTLVIGGHLALRGDMGIGAYSVLVFLTQRLLWPLTSLGETVDLYSRAMASTTRILDLLHIKPNITSGSKQLPQAQNGRKIHFNNVDFCYIPNHPVVNHLDFTIEAGTTVGFVGVTGAGKTSVIKLLLRFYDVDTTNNGSIQIDDIDIRQLELTDLRENIGLVSQDVFLFHGTIRENIAYGSFDATDEQISNAARLAEAHDFIEKLPQSYDTIVGERGQKLSGGQRQRISIARAILKNPPILVLDEATSAVDNETEAAIQRSLERISQNRTIVIIAHRLSTVRNANCILVMENGRIAESGTHEELLASKGIYHRVWQVQTGENFSLH